MERITGIAIVTLVALRLATGWHFFNEGVKKLDPDFTSAGFLRGAKGPLAPMFRSLVKGPHGAYEAFGKPVEYGSLDPESQAELDAWRADYGRRAAKAIDSGTAPPADIVGSAPGAEIVEKASAAWADARRRLSRLGAADDDAERLAQLCEEKLGFLVNFLHTESAAIEELQHEAWRLEQMEAKSGRRAPAPYQRDLITKKRSEVWRTMQPWVATIEQTEDDLVVQAVAITADEGPNAKRVESAFQTKTLLDWADLAVTCVVLGAGVCVFFGFMTRIAALLAAGFLLSLIATQPPWVPGTDTSAFFAWLIELIAFLVLAAVGAGRWAGIDGLIHQVRLRYGDLSPTYAPLRRAKQTD